MKLSLLETLKQSQDYCGTSSKNGIDDCAPLFWTVIDAARFAKSTAPATASLGSCPAC